MAGSFGSGSESFTGPICTDSRVSLGNSSVKTGSIHRASPSTRDSKSLAVLYIVSCNHSVPSVRLSQGVL